jgi:hypothetical protein
MKQERKIVSHVRDEWTHPTTKNKLVTIHIQWDGENPPHTHAVKRLSNPGWGVICLCQAYTYGKNCYHKKLVREYITQKEIT